MIVFYRLSIADLEPAHIREFTKTSLVNLIVRQLAATHPELLPADMANVDAVRHGLISAEYKREILDLIWRKANPETLLSIGQGVRDVEYDPIWHAAVRSASPALLFEKWRRFEVFAHSRNRVRIDLAGDKAASFQRYTVGGGTPSTPENLLICGLIIALLEEIGCVGLRCGMQFEDGTAYCIRENGRFFFPDDSKTLSTGAWSIEWRMFSPRKDNAATEFEPPGIPFPTTCGSALRASIETVARLLMLDVARQWKVGELAREAGLSARALQRKLHDAELSFSHLVRLVRIHEACRLLKDKHVSITTIGFCAGFADSSHFSRDFRASMGMTPSDYRTAYLGAP